MCLRFGGRLKLLFFCAFRSYNTFTTTRCEALHCIASRSRYQQVPSIQTAQILHAITKNAILQNHFGSIWPKRRIIQSKIAAFPHTRMMSQMLLTTRLLYLATINPLDNMTLSDHTRACHAILTYDVLDPSYRGAMTCENVPYLSWVVKFTPPRQYVLLDRAAHRQIVIDEILYTLRKS